MKQPIKVQLKLNVPQYLNDLHDLVFAFFPHLVVDSMSDIAFDIVVIEENRHTVFYSFSLQSTVNKGKLPLELGDNDLNLKKKYIKKSIKNKLYLFLSSFFNISLPYGSLTGVRPTIVYREGLAKGYGYEYLVNDYYVNKTKAQLIEKIVKQQSKVYEINESNVCIYINIPICPSKCTYCTFSSHELSKVKNLVQPYMSIVNNQLSNTLDNILKENLDIKSIYIGGGTPGVINLQHINTLLEKIKKLNCEITFEAGRVDTITPQLFDVLAENNVTRVSINPQSFNQETLNKVNRNTDIEDVYKVFEHLKKYNFSINSDLIVGLEEETIQDASYSLNKLFDLSPQNITLHSLSFKRGSYLTQIGKRKSFIDLNYDTEILHQKLTNNNYHPYYIYRQKNTIHNLENVGFTKIGHECLYNILNMEDICTVFGIGAGAVSKYYNTETNEITRAREPKDLNQFLKKHTNFLNFSI